MINRILLSSAILVSSFTITFSQSLNEVDFDGLSVNGGDLEMMSSFGFTETEIPVRYTLENYAFVSTQNGGSCVGFAVTGAMNIMHNYLNEFTGFDFKYVHTFDPYYLYCAIKDDNDIACIGENCNCGSFIYEALDIVKDYGVKKSSINPLLDCGNQISTNNLRALSEITSLYSIDEYYSLFDYEKIKGEWDILYNLNEFKSALSNKYPIITGINVDNSFGELGANNPKYFAGPDSNEGHAVTIVGYDDSKYGGAFRIMNSYGSEWGDNGFFWMTYDDYFDNSQRAFILDNESWDSWYIDKTHVSNNFYRGFSKDNTSFWEGPLNAEAYFHGKGIEITERHCAIGSYNNGFRNGWWLILEKSNIEDAWRGLVLFDNGEVIESESFGFSSNLKEKEGFIEGLHLDNFEIEFNDKSATEDDVNIEAVQNKVTTE